MTASTAPAGWYPDSEMVKTRRYWDGARWTEHRQEQTALPPAPPLGSPSADEPSPVTVGWGVVFALLLPIVGFFIGLALLGKRGDDGIKLVLLSVVSFVVWCFLLSM